MIQKGLSIFKLPRVTQVFSCVLWSSGQESTQAWGHPFIIPALERLGLEYCQFQVNLAYIGSSCLKKHSVFSYWLRGISECTVRATLPFSYLV